MMNTASTSDFVVNVRDLVRNPGTRRHVELRHPLTDLGTSVARVPDGASVAVAADVDCVVEGLLVTGEVVAPVRACCVRCLDERDSQLRVGVRELFVFDGDRTEEEGYAVGSRDLLVLETMVRDALALALPASPLCRPDCAGLCPECGQNRNASACSHEPVGDLRWQPLAGLELAADTETDPR